jgi:hypothetical protein
MASRVGCKPEAIFEISAAWTWLALGHGGTAEREILEIWSAT